MEKFVRNKYNSNIGEIKTEITEKPELTKIALQTVKDFIADTSKEDSRISDYKDLGGREERTITGVNFNKRCLHDWSYGLVDVVGLDIDKDKKEYKPLKLDNSHIIKDNKPYYTCDGKKVSTMEEVIEYNNLYYENLKEDKKLIR